MNKKNINFGWFMLLVLFFGSCSNEWDEMAPSGAASNDFSVRDAQAFFEENATVLAPLSFNSKQNVTKASGLSKLQLTPNWKKALVSGHRDVTLIEIPIISNSTLFTSEHIFDNGKFSYTKRMFSERRLVIAKRKDGTTDMFLITIILSVEAQGDILQQLKEFRYLGGSSFSGKVFCSTLDGQFVKAFGYTDGQQNGQLRITTKAQLKESGIDYSKLNYSTLGLNDGIRTKSGSYQFTEVEDKECENCHGKGCSECEGIDGGDFGEVVIIACPYCHARQDLGEPCKCFRCIYCGSKEGGCTCPRCTICKRKVQECECYTYPNPDGGGSTGGSGGGSGDNTGGGITPPHTTGTFKPFQITETAEKTVKAIIKQYGMSDAYCNYGVQTAFNQLYTTHELDNKQANALVEYWTNNPALWESINLSEAQGLANAGWFVVAGWKATQGHGHVVVIVPGVEQPGWGGKVPVCMDTGSEKRTSSQKLSSSFGKNKKDFVNFFKRK